MPWRERIVSDMDRARSRIWTLALLAAGAAAGCGFERYATFDSSGGGDMTFFREGDVTGTLNPIWFDGTDRFTLYFDGGEGLPPDVRDATIQVDWVTGDGRATPPRERCEAGNLSCEVSEPKGRPDDIVLEISFTLLNHGPSRRITRRLALHRTWDTAFWIFRGC